MQQFDLTTHKNASDMALAIDAVELLHSAAPDAFAIMSSDSDFTPLVHYLLTHTAMAGRPGAGPALALSLVLVAIVCASLTACHQAFAATGGRAGRE